MGGICRYCGQFDEYPNRSADGRIVCWKCADRLHDEYIEPEPETLRQTGWQVALFESNPCECGAREASFRGYSRVEVKSLEGNPKVEFRSSDSGYHTVTHLAIFRDNALICGQKIDHVNSVIGPFDVLTVKLLGDSP